MASNEASQDLAAIVARHRALAVLRLLNCSAVQGQVNDRLLADLLHKLGVGGSREAVRTSVQKLQDAGLVSTAPVPDYDLIVVAITSSGAEVAEGRTQAYGVEPYLPGGPY